MKKWTVLGREHRRCRDVSAASAGADDDPTAGIVKDTTHISVIDRDGNVFDSTPSGAWLPTRSSSDDTGIMMSVRGERSGSTRRARPSCVRARGRATR